MFARLITWLFLKVEGSHSKADFVDKFLREREKTAVPKEHYYGLVRRSIDADFQDEKITALMDEINSLQEKLNATEAKHNKLVGKASHIEAIRRNSLRK